MCRERLLLDVMESLGNSLDLQQCLGEFETQLRRLSSYDAMAVWLPADGRLTAGYVSGEEIPNGVGAEECRGQFGAVLSVPLEHDGEPAGVLALYRKESGEFGEDDRELLERFRRKCGAAVANAVRYQRIERLAAVDPDTLLPNGRALFPRLDAELARARRSHSTLAVLVCDFGKARVPWGPVAGQLRLACREDDCVARMGDSFVLVLGGFGQEHLAAKRQRLEELLRGQGLIPRVGHAFYPADGDYAEDLLAVAGERSRHP